MLQETGWRLLGFSRRLTLSESVKEQQVRSNRQSLNTKVNRVRVHPLSDVTTIDELLQLPTRQPVPVEEPAVGIAVDLHISQHSIVLPHPHRLVLRWSSVPYLSCQMREKTGVIRSIEANLVNVSSVWLQPPDYLQVLPRIVASVVGNSISYRMNCIIIKLLGNFEILFVICMDISRDKFERLVLGGNADDQILRRSKNREKTILRFFRRDLSTAKCLVTTDISTEGNIQIKRRIMVSHVNPLV